MHAQLFKGALLIFVQQVEKILLVGLSMASDNFLYLFGSQFRYNYSPKFSAKSIAQKDITLLYHTC